MQNLYIRTSRNVVTAVKYDEEQANMFAHLKNIEGIKEWIEGNGDNPDEVISFEGKILKVRHNKGLWMDYIIKKGEWIVKMENGKYISMIENAFRRDFQAVFPGGKVFYNEVGSEELKEYDIETIEFMYAFFNKRQLRFDIRNNEVVSTSKIGNEVLGHIYYSKKEYYKAKNRFRMAKEIEKLVTARGVNLLMKGTEEELYQIIQMLSRK